MKNKEQIRNMRIRLLQKDKEIERLNKKIESINSRLEYRDMQVKSREKAILNLKSEHEDKINKIVKEYKEYVDVRKSKNQDNKYDLTEYSSIMERDGIKYIRINIGDKALKKYTYLGYNKALDASENMTTSIEHAFNILINADKLLTRKYIDFTGRSFNRKDEK